MAELVVMYMARTELQSKFSIFTCFLSHIILSYLFMKKKQIYIAYQENPNIEYLNKQMLQVISVNFNMLVQFSLRELGIPNSIIFYFVIEEKYIYPLIICYVESLSEAIEVFNGCPNNFQIVYFTQDITVKPEMYQLLQENPLLRVNVSEIYTLRKTDLLSNFVVQMNKIIISTISHIESLKSLKVLQLLETICNVITKKQNKLLLEQVFELLGAEEITASTLVRKFGQIKYIRKWWEHEITKSKEQELCLYDLGQQCTNLEWKTAWGAVSFDDNITAVIKSFDDENCNVMLDQHLRPTKQFSKNVYEFLFGDINA